METRKKFSLPRALRILLMVLVTILGILAVMAAGALIWYTMHDYRPEDKEAVDVVNNPKDPLPVGEELSILTWNIGYCGLGEEADYFAAGGQNIKTYDKEEVQENLLKICEDIAGLDHPDIVLLQEVDDSQRAYDIKEPTEIAKALKGYQYSYSPDWKVEFIPYPMPPLGRVSSGLMTLGYCQMNKTRRISLPNAYEWPISTIQPKRCLLVSRMELQDSEKELVVINLHMEAYDDAEARKEQIRKLKEVFEAEEEKGNYVIAGGDFSQTFSGIDTDKTAPVVSEDLWQPTVLDTDLFDQGEKCLMDGSKASARSLDRPLKDAETDSGSFQYYIEDGFIVSSNVTVRRYGTVDLGFETAAHNPVLLTFELQE